VFGLKLKINSSETSQKIKKIISKWVFIFEWFKKTKRTHSLCRVIKSS